MSLQPSYSATLTPGRTRPSAIPTPGRSSYGGSIPTPSSSRPRSSTGGYLSDSTSGYGTAQEEMKALSEAMKNFDPTQLHRGIPPLASPALSDANPPGLGHSALSNPYSDAFTTAGPRKSLPTRSSNISTRPSSRASAADHPPQSILRSKTPTNPSFGSRPFAPRSSTASTASSYPSRPESRQSDVRVSVGLGESTTPAPSASFETADTNWKVGDSVRINSLGFEGTLRYIGGIEGKSGVFAGVELLPGFLGRGKNDGSVGGQRYFSCPPMTGVFVALRALSEPPVPRAPSVASSYGGRPSVSGRVTPSGRITPANYNGTIKAPPVTPTARKPIIPASTASIATTPGSRASKYIGVTAKQLSGSRTATPSSSSVPPVVSTAITPKAPRAASGGTGIATPGRAGSRIHGVGTTPKPIKPTLGSGVIPPLPAMPPPNRFPGHNQNPTSPTRRSFNTMLPPPSPRRQSATPTLSQTSSDTFVEGDRELHHVDPGSVKLLEFDSASKSFQDKIDGLRFAARTPSSPRKVSPALNGSSPPLASPMAANNPTSSQRIALERLKVQVKALEQENEELKQQMADLEASHSVLQTASAESSGDNAELATAREENARLASEQRSTLSQLESLQLQLNGQSLLSEEQSSTITKLTETIAASESKAKDLQDEVRSLETKLQNAEIKLRDSDVNAAEKDELLKSLKDAVEAKSSKEDQNAAVLNAKDKEIAQLEARLKREVDDLIEHNKELAGQVNELRLAGQETIALYEERLNTSEAKRYELEDMLLTLESDVRASENRPQSPTTQARNISTAAQIENESLKEQVSHFQQKISTLEDTIEDLKAGVERDEAAIKQRIGRYKDNEGVLRKELDAARNECERLAKAELAARTRVEEVGEALRESDLALENARAEIEVFRNEQAVALQGSEPGVVNDKMEEQTKRAAAEKTRLLDEISTLKENLESARASRREASEASEIKQREVQLANSTLDELNARITLLESEKEEMERANSDQAARLAGERKLVAELRQAVEDKGAELEIARKASSQAVNKELTAPLTSRDNRRDSTQSNSSRNSRRSADPSRDENLKDQVTGLKHIVQELQRENSTAKSQIASLQGEKALLQTDIEELRDLSKNLEALLQESVDKDEKALQDAESQEFSATPLSEENSSPQEVQVLIKDMKIKHEAELEQIQKRVSDLEKEHNKTLLALNKDIGDLENLVEAKIYREDDLEREIERLKEKLARYRANSKTSGDSVLSHSQRPASSVGSVSTDQVTSAGDESVCEICGEKGHDIVSCEVVFSPGGVIGLSSINVDRKQEASVADDLWCNECEVLGDHITEECPHSTDVF